MKFMQRRDEQTAAAPPQQQSANPLAHSHQWSAPPLQSSAAVTAAAATATAAVDTQPRIRILGSGDESDAAIPPAFISGRRSFGRNKALEVTLDELARAGQAVATRATRGTDARGEDSKEDDGLEDEEKDVWRRRKNGRDDTTEGWRGRSERGSGRSSEGSDRDDGRVERDRRGNDSRKRRATMSVMELGREEQQKKKQQRLQHGFMRPADTG